MLPQTTADISAVPFYSNI